MAEKHRKRPTQETSSDSNKMAKTTLTLELPPDYEGWEEEKLCQFLEKWHKTVKEKNITVARLKDPTDPPVQEGLGMSIFKQQIKVEGKVFNDPIHGHVELHPLLVEIINTPQFDRLRHIRQLGGAYYVFPGACHNRFEHSIGVAHLAGQFAQALRSNQPELGIDDEDILCVQIAGLCHDLGHGPFSHLFEKFIKKMRKKEGKPGDWEHEKNSLKMFDHMVNEYVVKHGQNLKEYNLKQLKEQDKTFIKEMMTGKPQETATGDQWPYKGRGKDKSFLYEIVANKTNGIDVDKFDYFARDCHHLGIQNHFDHQRFFQFARVCQVDGRMQICVRDKEVHNLYEMFYARCSFHRKAYQHKTNKLIETMIIDAFIKADDAFKKDDGFMKVDDAFIKEGDAFRKEGYAFRKADNVFIKADGHIKIKGSRGKIFTLSTAIDDMEAYTKLTDRVFEDILHHPSYELKEARHILERIIKRDLYKHVGTIVTTNRNMNEEVKNRWNESTPIGGLTEDDFALVDTSLDYGDGEIDPISKVRFYSKEKPDEAKPIPRDEVSRLLPEHFSEGSVRVYLKKKENDEKKDEKNLEDAKNHFRQLFTNEDFEVKDENKGLVARPR